MFRFTKCVTDKLAQSLTILFVCFVFQNILRNEIVLFLAAVALVKQYLNTRKNRRKLQNGKFMLSDELVIAFIVSVSFRMYDEFEWWWFCWCVWMHVRMNECMCLWMCLCMTWVWIVMWSYDCDRMKEYECWVCLCVWVYVWVWFCFLCVKKYMYRFKYKLNI